MFIPSSKMTQNEAVIRISSSSNLLMNKSFKNNKIINFKNEPNKTRLSDKVDQAKI